jgi:hypothetical protein
LLSALTGPDGNLWYVQQPGNAIAGIFVVLPPVP